MLQRRTGRETPRSGVLWFIDFRTVFEIQILSSTNQRTTITLTINNGGPTLFLRNVVNGVDQDGQRKNSDRGARC